MKRLARWLLIALGIGLVGWALYCARDAPHRSYARVRLMSIFLHRGMSPATVQWLLGGESGAVVSTASFGETMEAVCWDRWGGPGPPLNNRPIYRFPNALTVNFLQVSNGSPHVTNWCWVAFPLSPPRK